MVFFDRGNWTNLSAPAYVEKEPSGSLPIGDFDGGEERDIGFEPESSFP